ncbi:hypothetical protein CY35_09G043200 [Sphagnum magellanicum]|nr:hypothetical protein CY35_09G043200 [Sphagnum magellanicum]
MLEICLNEPDRVENWRGILQQQQEIMQILQNQAFFFEKGRQDILPHCNDISDSEAQRVNRDLSVVCLVDIRCQSTNRNIDLESFDQKRLFSLMPIKSNQEHRIKSRSMGI